MNAAANCTGGHWTASMENLFVKDIIQTDLQSFGPSAVTNVELLLLTIPIKETGQIHALNCAFFLKLNVFSAVIHMLCLERKERQIKERPNPLSMKKKFLEKIYQNLTKHPPHFGRTFPGCYVLTRWLSVDHRLKDLSCLWQLDINDKCAEMSQETNKLVSTRAEVV